MLNETEIVNLVKEIENVQAMEFWYGSKLLERASKCEDPRVTRALTIRHHFLQNKSAGSCYVLRHTIKAIEAPYFNTLWEMIESSDFHESQAASFILGEIGGLWTFQKLLNLLRNSGAKTYSYTIPCLIHLIGRYYDIIEEAEPTIQVVDVRTGQMRTESMKDSMPDNYASAMRDRMLSNEYFILISGERIDEMIALLQKVPDSRFPGIDKEKFIKAIYSLKAQTN